MTSGRTTGATEPGADLIAADLACRRGERLVFAGLSFRLVPGGALMLTGANGSGKTSLLRLLAGLAAPAAARTRPIVGDAGGAVAPRRALRRARSRQSEPLGARHRGASRNGRTCRSGNPLADRDRHRRRDQTRRLRAPAQCRRRLKMAV